MAIALRIVATVFVGVSCLTALIKNIFIFDRSVYTLKNIFLSTLYGWLWRAFVLVAIWLI